LPCFFFQKIILAFAKSTHNSRLLPITFVYFAGKVYAHQVVRTDCREQKLDAFFTPSSKTKNDPPSTASTAMSDSALDDLIMCIDENEDSSVSQRLHGEPKSVDNQRQLIEDESLEEASSARFSPVVGSVSAAETDGTIIPTTSSWREIKLTSVRQLQTNIESNIHDG
jgi:hypothetical protein